MKRTYPEQGRPLTASVPDIRKKFAPFVLVLDNRTRTCVNCLALI